MPPILLLTYSNQDGVLTVPLKLLLLGSPNLPNPVVTYLFLPYRTSQQLYIQMATFSFLKHFLLLVLMTPYWFSFSFSGCSLSVFFASSQIGDLIQSHSFRYLLYADSPKSCLQAWSFLRTHMPNDLLCIMRVIYPTIYLHHGLGAQWASLTEHGPNHAHLISIPQEMLPPCSLSSQEMASLLTHLVKWLSQSFPTLSFPHISKNVQPVLL